MKEKISPEEAKKIAAFGMTSGLISVKPAEPVKEPTIKEPTMSQHRIGRPPGIKKSGKFKCRWCGHLKKKPGYCERCGNRGFKLAVLSLFCMFLIGCRTYHYSKTERGETVKVGVWMFLSNTKVEYMKVQFLTNRVDIVVRKGSTEVDEEAVKAISQGVTTAVLEAIKKP